MDSLPLSSDQVAAFHQEGFLTCPGFFDSSQHSRISDWVVELSQLDDSGQWVHYREMTGSGPVLARTERFLSSHDGLRQTFTQGRLISAVEQLFGEPACVFKDKVNYKYPGGGGFNPHQDAAAYHRFGSLHITALVAVDENTVANGCLWFAREQHKQGLLPVNDVGCLSPELSQPMEWVATPVEAGGVLFFGSFAPHKSEPNHSQQPRRSLYLTYGKESEGNLRDAYYEDRGRVMDEHHAERGEDYRVSTIGHFQGKAVE